MFTPAAHVGPRRRPSEGAGRCGVCGKADRTACYGWFKDSCGCWKVIKERLCGGCLFWLDRVTAVPRSVNGKAAPVLTRRCRFDSCPGDQGRHGHRIAHRASNSVP